MSTLGIPGPARYRGRTDIWINGSYWAGSVAGTLLSFLLLNSLAADVGWRLAFLIGPLLAVVILFVRRNLPESPRWLITHGREREAPASMRHIEQSAIDDGQHLAQVSDADAISIVPEKDHGYLRLLRLIIDTYPAVRHTGPAATGCSSSCTTCRRTRPRRSGAGPGGKQRRTVLHAGTRVLGNPIEAQFGPIRIFVVGGSDHPSHTVLARNLQEYLRWRNAYARHPDVLAAQCRERVRVRGERQQRWGRPRSQAA